MTLVEFTTFKKLRNIPWAVSGLKYIFFEESDEAPISVENIKLNCFTSVQLEVPDIGSLIFKESIKFFKPFKSFDLRHEFILDETSSIWLEYFNTLSLVSLKAFSSNLSPNLFLAFLTSFSTLELILEI